MNGTVPKLVIAIVFTLLMGYFILQSPWPQGIPEENSNPPTVAIGNYLFTNYGTVFMVVSLLLIAALLGAVFLAKEETP